MLVLTVGLAAAQDAHKAPLTWDGEEIAFLKTP
jgi:hypothetical protein